jgi:hypothetical protein
LSVLPPKPSQTDGATGSAAGFGAVFFSFFAPANPSQTDGLTKAGVGFGAGFFFRVVFFILFFARAEALRFAFLDFFAMFSTTHCYSSIMSGCALSFISMPKSGSFARNVAAAALAVRLPRNDRDLDFGSRA